MDNVQDHLHKQFHDNRLLVKVPQVTFFFWIIKVLCTTVGETFAAWYRSEKTLSIHSIFTARREAFYWLTILFTFALGTGVGDLIAERFDLGYGVSFFIFAAAIAVVSLLWKFKVINSVLGFWAVYVITRPLGAAIGDQMAQNDPKYGGWGLGTTNTSYIFLSLILALVIYLGVSKKDQIVLDPSALKD